MRKHFLGLTATIAAVVLTTAPVAAQHASEFTARDKTEIFIQHVVKFMNVSPAKYRPMVLEYEIGSALAEAAATDGFSGPEIGSNFVENGLRELVGEYREALELFEAEKDEEASPAVRTLLGHLDPYVSAHAGMLRAELDFRARDYDNVVDRCEGISLRNRLYLIHDYRACELIALCFEKREKPLLELAQYAILLTDYQDVPADLERRAKNRLAVLKEKVGLPLHTVAGWMNHVEKFLSDELTSDEPTQYREREIVLALDKLIELQEAKERNTCSGCGGNCKGGCKNGNPKGNRSKNPALVSKLPPAGEGIVGLRGVSRANADSIWGELRAKDASRALQSFRGKLPARYQKLLEQYYKDLAREK